MLNNYFDFLLSVRLGNETRHASKIDLKDVQNFPRYSVPKIKDKIAYGPYQVNQGKSYLRDFKIDSSGYSISTDLLYKVRNRILGSILANCKIIA